MKPDDQKWVVLPFSMAAAGFEKMGWTFAAIFWAHEVSKTIKNLRRAKDEANGFFRCETWMVGSINLT